MSSDDVTSPHFQQKSASSSFADVFKTLASGRPRSQSPVPYGQGVTRPEPLQMEGRRGSRVTFGFESLHRPSLVASSASADAAAAVDFEAVLRHLSRTQSLAGAADEADKTARILHCFTADQVMSIWETASYLIDEPASPEARRAGSRLLEAVANRQDLSLPSRRIVYNSICHPSAPDVIPNRVNSLIALADHGRKLDFTDGPVLPTAALWILPLYDLTAASRSRLKKSKNPRADVVNTDEAALGNLFQFIIDLITLQRYPPADQDIELLLKQVIAVCKKTNVAGDIKNSLSVFDAVISASVIPESIFDCFVEVLCNIHASVKALAGPTSRVVRNLAKSQRQSELIKTLHSFLSESADGEERNLNVVRGAVNVFTDLVRAYGQDGMPSISFDSLIGSLMSSAKRNDGRIDSETLEVCVSVLQGEYVNTALENGWTNFVQLILTCSQRVTDTYAETATAAITAPPPTAKPSAIDDVRSNISANISRICSAVENIWQILSKEQRMDALRLFTDVHRHLTVGQSKLALDLCKQEELCYPSHPDWISRSWMLIECFILDRDKSPETRILALSTFEDAYFRNGSPELFNTEGFISSFLANFEEERSHLFLQSLVSFFVEVATSCDEGIFSRIVDALSSPMRGDEQKDDNIPTTISSQPVSTPVSSADLLVPSLSNILSTGLVRVFLRVICGNSTRASVIYERLVNIAKSPNRPTDSRLTVLRLLFRLRCDSAGSIYVVTSIQNQHLISVLSRTIDASRTSVSDDVTTERSPASIESHTSGRFLLRDPSSGPLSSGGNANHRSLRWTAPIWTSDERKGLPEEAPCMSKVAVAFRNEPPPDTTDGDGKVILKLNLWLESVITILQREKDWDVYSYVLAYLGPQLANRDLFRNAMPQIQLLRSVLCEQIKNESFHEPLGWTGVKKGDVAVCILEALTMLISFHHYFAKSEQDEIVRAFMLGIGSWESTSRPCIHALSVCCHEIPLSVTKSLNAILDKMSKVITRSHIAVHILEFLALLARLPSVYVNLRDEEIRTVFGICLRFIQTSRERRRGSVDQTAPRSNSIPSRLSGGLKEIASSPASETPGTRDSEDMSRYVYYLTYHVMVFWFLSLKLQDRANHISWITKRLIFTDERGKDVIEEQSQVFIDFMQRVAFSDLGDTIPFEKFPPSETDGPVSKKSWIVGMSIVTVETAGASGLSQVTKRQASGTTYSMYQQRTAPVLPHQIPASPDSHSLSDPPYSRSSVLPSHVLLQLTTTAFPTPISMQPLPLPDDEFTRRAISTFDRNDIVDGHKIGVIYIGEGQTDETSILANTSGSPDYELFLSSLGTKVSIKDAKFNTQGLHYPTDGEFTYAWRDRVTEIIFHITTMMPTNLEIDPHCIYKKQHVGNDFVNIIFNRSNLPFTFDTIRSQFNYVNIVITPASRITTDQPGHDAVMNIEQFNHTFYKVQVLSKPGFPQLSASANPKIISGKNLGTFVRLIAVNASVFSLVASRGDEYVSSWQNRLREIRRLRDRAFAASASGADTGAEISYPAAARRNTKPDESAAAAGLRSSLSASKTLESENNVFQTLDFSRWS
ncbi:hypothetical protein VTO42DRAFT_215 [Malbranchea cinnamomea]